MKNRKLAISFIAGLLMGAFALTAHAASSPNIYMIPGSGEINDEINRDAKKNEHGQTYGSGAAQPLPDLVRVGLKDGTIGYIYANEMRKPASGPEEAAAEMKKINEALAEARAKGPSIDSIVDRSIPVYMPDGKTVIGSWDIGYTDPSTNPPPEELQQLKDESQLK